MDTGGLSEKMKFLTQRLFPYFLFTLFFFLDLKFIADSRVLQFFLTVFIGYFVGLNFYLIGVYLDHIFKIYYHLNSSLDRIIYRTVFGASLISVTVYILNILECSTLFMSNFFIGLFGLNFVFSVYPTSSRVVYSSLRGNLGELKHLDKVEKTILALFLIYFFVSTPDLDYLNIKNTAFLIHGDILNQSFPSLVSIFSNIKIGKVATGYFYYFLGGLFYLLTYSFFRFFFSRRVSLIGLLALVSNWNLAKLIYGDFSVYTTSLYLIIFLWSLIWVGKSKSYRTSLYYGIILNLATHHPLQVSIPLVLIGFFARFLTERNQTKWAKLQSLKYMLGGIILAILLLKRDFTLGAEEYDYVKNILSYNLIFKKAFNILAPIGLIVFIYTYLNIRFGKIKKAIVFANNGGLILFSHCFFCFTLILSSWGQVFDMTGFVFFYVIFMCLPALEVALSSINSFNSKRNLMYFIYLLFAILDSHFESRVKSFFTLIKNY